MAKTSNPKSAAAAPFNIDALKSLSGEATFARGAAYHAAGRVEVVSSRAGRITAKVLGSETYEARLNQGADYPAGDHPPQGQTQLHEAAGGSGLVVTI